MFWRKIFYGQGEMTNVIEQFGKVVDSKCLNCGSQLCKTAVAVCGNVECTKCGALNVFDNTLLPVRLVGLMPALAIR